MTLEITESWSPAEDNQLRHSLQTGISFTRIANLLLRSERDVIERAAWLQRCAIIAAKNVPPPVKLTEAEIDEHFAIDPIEETTFAPIDDVMEQLEEVVEADKPKKGACLASIYAGDGQVSCILKAKHKGDHLSDYIGGDTAIIFKRNGDWMMDIADVYLTYCLQQDLVAPA